MTTEIIAALLITCLAIWVVRQIAKSESRKERKRTIAIAAVISGVSLLLFGLLAILYDSQLAARAIILISVTVIATYYCHVVVQLAHERGEKSALDGSSADQQGKDK